MNPLHAFFDELALPWRQSRADLIARHGLRRCPWSLDEVVEIGGAATLLPGLIRPLRFHHRPFHCKAMPPLIFTGYASPERSAMRNLEAVAQALAARIGPGEYSGNSGNVRGYSWRCGQAELSLFVSPPHLQDHRGGDEWHEREPRLIEACSISIDSGYRPPLTAAEAEWIERFEPALRLHDGSLPPPPEAASASQPRTSWLGRLFGAPAAPKLASQVPTLAPPTWDNPVQAHVGNTAPVETAIDYVCEPPPAVERVFGWLGSDPAGEALIWCDDQLRIVPRNHVRALRHDRIPPERGGDGDSELSLQCRRLGEERDVEVLLVRRYSMDALDELAGVVAAWAGLPLESKGWS